MVVRKAAIHLAIERLHRATQAREERRRHGPGDAVAAIHDDLHRPRQTHVGDDARNVLVHHPGAPPRAPTGEQAAFGDARAQILDGGQRQGFAADHHFQAVVIRRIVAAGHRNAGLAAQRVRGEIGDRRRHAADVDGVHAGGGDALDQRLGERRAGQATVAADGNRRLLPLAGERAERLADGAHAGGRQADIDDAANVVRLENLGGKLVGHGRTYFSVIENRSLKAAASMRPERRCAAQCRTRASPLPAGASAAVEQCRQTSRQPCAPRMNTRVACKGPLTSWPSCRCSTT